MILLLLVNCPRYLTCLYVSVYVIPMQLSQRIGMKILPHEKLQNTSYFHFWFSLGGEADSLMGFKPSYYAMCIFNHITAPLAAF